jgi:hypothetical protein
VIVLEQSPRIRAQLTLPFRGYGAVHAALDDPAFDAPSDQIATVLSRRGQLTELNVIAALVWESLSTPRTFAELSEEVASYFEVDGDDWKRDIQALLFELLDLGLAEASTTTAHKASVAAGHPAATNGA